MHVCAMIDVYAVKETKMIRIRLSNNTTRNKHIYIIIEEKSKTQVS